MSERKKLLSPKASRRLWRLLLRSLPIPLLQGPEIYDLLKDLRKSGTDLDQQVGEAIESLQQSSQLVSQLEEGLQERSHKLTELWKECERYSELAEIEEKKVEPLIKQLEITIGKERGRERWFAVMLNFIIGLIFFIAGVLFSSPLQKWFRVIWNATFGG